MAENRRGEGPGDEVGLLPAGFSVKEIASATLCLLQLPKLARLPMILKKNSLGRYGIQPYQFEPRVETVTFVGALEQLEALREKTRGVFHLPRDSGNSGSVANGT